MPQYQYLCHETESTSLIVVVVLGAVQSSVEIVVQMSSSFDIVFGEAKISFHTLLAAM